MTDFAKDFNFSQLENNQDGSLVKDLKKGHLKVTKCTFKIKCRTGINSAGHYPYHCPNYILEDKDCLWVDSKVTDLNRSKQCRSLYPEGYVAYIVLGWHIEKEAAKRR